MDQSFLIEPTLLSSLISISSSSSSSSCPYLLTPPSWNSLFLTLSELATWVLALHVNLWLIRDAKVFIVCFHMPNMTLFLFLDLRLEIADLEMHDVSFERSKSTNFERTWAKKTFYYMHTQNLENCNVQGLPSSRIITFFSFSLASRCIQMWRAYP